MLPPFVWHALSQPYWCGMTIGMLLQSVWSGMPVKWHMTCMWRGITIMSIEWHVNVEHRVLCLENQHSWDRRCIYYSVYWVSIVTQKQRRWIGPLEHGIAMLSDRTISYKWLATAIRSIHTCLWPLPSIVVCVCLLLSFEFHKEAHIISSKCQVLRTVTCLSSLSISKSASLSVRLVASLSVRR